MTKLNWNWRPLGELFEIGAGKTMSPEARAGVRKVPFLRTSNVLWDDIDLSTLDKMSISARELAEKSLRAGDLLVCEGGAIGRAALWDGQVDVMSFQNHLHRLRPLSPDVEPRFYVYFLHSAFTQLGIFQGAANKTTIPNLSRNRLAALKVPHPPLHEQQAIASSLAELRRAIKIHGKATGISGELKRAAMRALFTRGLHGIGAAPVIGRTQAARLGDPDVAEVILGQSPPSSAYNDVGNGLPFFQGKADFGLLYPTARMWCNGGSRFAVAGDVLMSVRAPVGDVNIATSDCIIGRGVAAIRAGVRTDPWFLYFSLLYVKPILESRATGSTFASVNKATLNDLEIPWFEKAEQIAIGSILRKLIEKIALKQQKRTVLEDLFKSLLHKLMTGEVKVDDLNLSALKAARRTTEEATA